MRKRKRNLFQTLVFIINSIFAILLLMAYLLPYISPKIFPFISVLSLGVPVLIAVNLAFVFYWLIFFRREVLLSAIVLILGFNHLLSLYRFKSSSTIAPSQNEVKLLSYNVRQFNRYGWIHDDTIPEQIEDFIQGEDPDIIFFQEYVPDIVDLPEYEYVYQKIVIDKFGQAIYSKYPLLNGTSLDFPNTGNNAIYADVVIDQDTIRLFNIHLQSLKIGGDIEKRSFDKKTGKRMVFNIGTSFLEQQKQVEQLLDTVEESPYRNIIQGDMNNTPYSYIYRKLTENFQDAFKVKGKGYGKSFNVNFIPLRIDISLIDPTFKIKDFITNNGIKLSDHYSISTTIEIKE